MRVERYSHVMHMVSDVEAILQEDKDMFDLFAATFTAGTMTGAPKIKAMELIAHYENLKRGFLQRKRRLLFIQRRYGFSHCHTYRTDHA